MTKIPLRSYFREIESLVERGMNEEAVAHCRFILKYYPKSIETYRLLSKAFLESQRYSEAADILQRILSVNPDDFFALIGMSITREDEGNLDAAIFYMERAYESQPANVAVQDELRRLYGRRDGVEPPKLRLSRGALIRMYHKGGLNRQAIAEITSALKEDPQRTDLETILAKIYMDMGDKAQALEVASRILSQLPFCYDANLILVNILPTTTENSDAQINLDRLISLDPYFSFISSTCPTVQQVPDNAVVIDRLDWQASESVVQPAWAQNIGVALDQEVTEKTPDWMVEGSTTTEGLSVNTFEQTPTETVADETINKAQSVSEIPDSSIPDWMQQAGWSLSDGTTIETMESTAPEGEIQEVAEAAQADLPDWLKELAPTGLELSEEITPDDQAKIELLDQILPPTDSIETALPFEEQTQVKESIEPEAVSEAKGLEIADILTDLTSDTAVGSLQVEENLPPSENIQPLIPIEEKWVETEEKPVMSEAATPADLPDWLANLATDQPEALQSIVEEQSEPPSAPQFSSEEVIEKVDAETIPSEEENPTGVPDWLANLATDQSEALQTIVEVPSEPPSVVQFSSEEVIEQVDAEEQTLPSEEATPAGVPDWLADLSIDQPEVNQPIIEEKSGPLSVTQIAPEELMEFERLNSADQISEEPLPDWIKDIVTSEEVAEHVPQEEFAGIQPSMAAEFSVPEAVEAESIEQPTPVVLETALPQSDVEDVTLAEQPQAEQFEPEISAISAPTMVEDLSTSSEQVELSSEEVMPSVGAGEIQEKTSAGTMDATLPLQEGSEMAISDLNDADAAMAWLESLAARQGAAEETLITSPDERPENPPEWVQAFASSIPVEESLSKPAATESLPDEPSNEEEIISAGISDLTEEPSASSEFDVSIDAIGSKEINLSEEMPAEAESVPAQAPAEMDFDTAFAWLESLAAKQGASEETLITPADERPIPDQLIIEEPTIEEASSPTQPLKLTEIPPVEELENESIIPQEPIEVFESDQTKPISETIATEESEVPHIETPVFTEASTPDQEPSPISSQVPKHTGELGPLPEWLKGISTESAPEPTSPESSAPAELPEWLRSLESVVDNPPQTPPSAEALPEWLSNIEKSKPETPPPPETTGEQAPDWVQGIAESEGAFAGESEDSLTQEVLEKFDELEAIPAGTETPQLLLNAAQTALSAGKIEISMRYYTRLIQNQSLIEETIHDLRDALYRYPIDISIWQTLGDAYYRNNQIQDALDSYTKAEEFLR